MTFDADPSVTDQPGGTPYSYDLRVNHPLVVDAPVEHDVQGKTDGVGERDVVSRIVEGLPGPDVLYGYGDA